jgi:SAM-dependent methyltransferase
MTQRYSGQELPLMAQATNWKSYLAELIRPYLGPTVLEVGAGIGGNIPHLHQPPVRDWTALEPDPVQAAQIVGSGVRVVLGTLAALDAAERFDAILYIDVLEHIADDAAELRQAAAHLAPGGRLIVLAPAHPYLFSRMDAAIGHHRRYTMAGLRALTPRGCGPGGCGPGGCGSAGCRLERLWQVDAAGWFASLANRLVLHRAQPTAGQIAVWDRVLVPISRRLDRRLRFGFGKSILAVWRRVDDEPGAMG